MSDSKFKPRGGGLLFSLILLALLLPVCGVAALIYLDYIELPNNFFEKLSNQIGLTVLFSILLVVVVKYVSRAISKRVGGRD